MTYDEALAYLQGAGMSNGAPGLDRERALLGELGNVQDALRFVHVAGTNGKGSVCAMLDAILRASGYKTGLFTSPYLRRFNERMRINGQCISDGELADVTALVKAAAGRVGASFSEFELDTAVGMVYFARNRCDIVVLEVGLGGRLDPTNVIKCPACAVITNIGLDHTKLLGDTPEKILREKAGIIKPGCCAAVYDFEDDRLITAAAEICRARGASLRVADFDEIDCLGDDLDGQEFSYCGEEPVFLPLLGDHQLKNAAVVLEAVEILRERRFKISPEAVAEGLASTVWPARFEIVSDKPRFVVDGGHNQQCAEAVRENLEYYFTDMRRVLLLGIMADKDVDGFADAIAPAADVFVCVKPDSPRALDAGALAEKLARFEKPVFVCGSIAEGIETAQRAAGENGMVCAVGSLYMAGDVRAYFGLE